MDANRERLQSMLSDQIEVVEQLLESIEINQSLADDKYIEFSTTFTLLKYKDIPATMCNEIKLIERIDELCYLEENIKFELK